MLSFRWVFLVFLFSGTKVFSSVISENAINSIKSDEASDSSASDIVKKVIAKGCAKKYTMTCFKMDMVELVDMLSASNTYQIFPGIAVVKDNTVNDTTTKKLPDTLIKSLASDFPYGETKQLDEFLIAKITDYISSHSVNLKLMDSPMNNLAQGRGKGNKGYGSLMAGVMMMKGTLMTIGLGALAALAGKALMTGLLSLMLSAIIALRSNNNGLLQRQATYEIISKPLYSHSHSHTAEISHNHDHGHEHSSYSYGRNLDFNNENQSFTKSEVEYLPEDEEEEHRPPHHINHYNPYGNIEYKTITEEDLRAYYNNLEFNNGGNSNHRNGKSFRDGSKPPLKPNSPGFDPVPALLNPDMKTS